MSLITDYNPDEVSSGTGKAKAITVPQGPEFIVVKFLVDTRVKDENGKPSRYYSYNTHSHEAEVRGKNMNLPHPCGKVMFDTCPECDRYYKALDKCKKFENAFVDAHFGGKWPKRKDLEKAMAGEIEYQIVKDTRDLFKPSRRAIFLVNQLGKDTVDALSVPQSVVNEIFGAAAYGDKPASEGIYTTLKRDGYNIFNLKNPSDEQLTQGMKRGGWVKLWSTGSVQQGNFKYHVQHYKTLKTVKLGDGSSMEGEFVCEDSVNPGLFKLTQEDLPNVKSIANAYGWTLEQIQTYADSNGKTLPKFGKKKTEAKDDVKSTPKVKTKDPEDFEDFDEDDSELDASISF